MVLDDPIPTGFVHIDPAHMKTCNHCGLRYDWQHSASVYLKMTYCSSICEAKEEGHTIDALLKARREEHADADEIDLLGDSD